MWGPRSAGPAGFKEQQHSPGNVQVHVDAVFGRDPQEICLQGKEKELLFPAKQESKAHPSKGEIALQSREQAEASFAWVHLGSASFIMLALCWMFFLCSHCHCSAHGHSLFCLNCPSLISSLLGIVPEQGVLCLGSQTARQPLP